MFMQRTATFGATCGGLVPLLFFSTAAKALTASDVITAAQSTSGTVQHLIVLGYQAAPALMLGLALLVVLPLMALATPAITRVRRSADATRRYKTSGQVDVTSEITGDTRHLPATDLPAPRLPTHAFLEIVGGTNTRFAILRDMLRIGREDDNDIRIPSTAVHRYHAAIHREHMEDWHITDLSGIEGNGIRVNGQPCSDAVLSDGDVIELGPGRLRFRAGLI
jgi:FHA domain